MLPNWQGENMRSQRRFRCYFRLRRGRTAFTLIELLVVIAIIALLMAILLPIASRVRKQAQTLGCRSKLRQWGSLFAAQAVANPGETIILPYAVPSGPNGAGFAPADDAAAWIPGTKSYDWEGSLERRYGPQVPDLLLCPAASRLGRRPKEGPTAPWRPWGYGDTFSARWAELPKPNGLRKNSYGHNDRALFLGSSTVPALARQITLDTKGAASVPILFDCADWYGGGGPFDPPPPYELPGGVDPWVAGGQWGSVCINRHNGGINCLFLDWSVRKVGLKELWTLHWGGPGYDTAGPWTTRGGVRPENWPLWMRRFKDY
jgi:prepilin-type N-terminal cleavage/methylation domain-containing protein/prepilin-type processing-associated H-X9-DG protein